jgi:tRNA(Arg) A34 adenosine deaminase TadA
MTGSGADAAWARAIELAWESFCAGTTPVGAVVVTGDGAVIAEGRGRRYETAAPPGQLAGSDIAHAEVNALAQLAAGQRHDDHVLLTTLEPCGMCHGAAIQAGLGAVWYAGADPYGGTGSLAFGNPQSERRRLAVRGPLGDERGRLAELLHILWLTARPAGPHVLAAQRAGLPELTSVAERAGARELSQAAAAGQITLDAVRDLLPGSVAAPPTGSAELR